MTTLAKDQALALRCLYEWCYVGRTLVDHTDVTRLRCVPFYLVVGELNEVVADEETTLRLLVDKGSIKETTYRFGLHGGHIGWRLPDGQILKVTYSREVGEDGERKRRVAKVWRNDQLITDEVIMGTGPSRAYELTPGGILEAEDAYEVAGTERESAARVDFADLPRSRRMAYHQYTYAIEKEPALADATDREIYTWLLKHPGPEDEGVPDKYETFTKYLTEVRIARGERKNTRRAGRSSHSVARMDDF